MDRSEVKPLLLGRGVPAFRGGYVKECVVSSINDRMTVLAVLAFDVNQKGKNFLERMDVCAFSSQSLRKVVHIRRQFVALAFIRGGGGAELGKLV